MLRTTMMKAVLIMLGPGMLLGCSSNSSHLDDPNAQVVVTSQYEGSAEKLILPSTTNCSPPFNCASKKLVGANCAAALYNNAKEYMEEGITLELKGMYLAARVQYLMAECRLKKAQIVLNEAKLTNYIDFKIATSLGLDKKIKFNIKICQRKGMILDWKR